MKKISEEPSCFTISVKEIMDNNNILSPRYYIEKEKHKEFNDWFSKLILKQKDLLKSYHNFIEERRLK